MTNFLGHIHTHTEWSLMDGQASIKELITTAKDRGQSFIAITDHGSSAGLYEAWKLGKELSFPVLLGEEFYIDVYDEKYKIGHLILIAKNKIGLRNLFKLQALANDNFYRKPRIDYSMLEEYNEGLICTTACIANPIHQALEMKENIAATDILVRLYNIFSDDLYIELQCNTMEKVKDANKAIYALSEGICNKYICTTDVHYLNKEDYEVHEHLLCMATNGKWNDPKRFSMDTNDYWLKTGEEMYETFNIPELWETCCNNIEEIYNKCETDLFELSDHHPVFVSAEEDKELFHKKINEGVKKKLIKRNEYSEEIKNDILHECSVIEEMGYEGYFLIVAEFCNWARKNIVCGSGRGSGAGSIVAYTMDITNINPKQYDLLFERFLDLGRVPDIDSDVSDRDEVFKHLQELYGKDNVAMVGAPARFTVKNLLRKFCSVYGMNLTQTNEQAKYVEDDKDWEEQRNNFVDLLVKYPILDDVMRTLVGKINNISTHAGGVIIYKGLTEELPVFVRGTDKDKYIIQLGHNELEEMGHYKFDILGLSSLNVLKDIEAQLSVTIDWSKVDRDDERLYEELVKSSYGIFQLSEQSAKVKQMNPKNFDDLIALNALIRPGVVEWDEYLDVRKNGSQKIYKDLYFMKCTDGAIVFQEQYEQLAQHYAGWSIGYADKHLRKSKNIMAEKESFINDCLENGYTLSTAEEVFADIANCVKGGYSFNKSHATAYADFAFKTLYLRTYYPMEFYSAILTSKLGDTVELEKAIKHVRSLKIAIFNPDINYHEPFFKVAKKNAENGSQSLTGILPPLTIIKGISGGTLWDLKRMEYIKDFEDLMERRIPKFTKKNNIENMIGAGLFSVTEEQLEKYKLSPPEGANKEMDVYGFYFTKNPLERFNNSLFPDSNVYIAVLSEITERKDKRGNAFAFLTISTQYQSISAICFSNQYKEYKEMLKKNKIYSFTGTCSDKFIISKIKEVEL